MKNYKTSNVRTSFDGGKTWETLGENRVSGPIFGKPKIADRIKNIFREKKIWPITLTVTFKQTKQQKAKFRRWAREMSTGSAIWRPKINGVSR